MEISRTLKVTRRGGQQHRGRSRLCRRRYNDDERLCVSSVDNHFHVVCISLLRRCRDNENCRRVDENWFVVVVVTNDDDDDFFVVDERNYDKHAAVTMYVR